MLVGLHAAPALVLSVRCTLANLAAISANSTTTHTSLDRQSDQHGALFTLRYALRIWTVCLGQVQSHTL